ncbi:MAG: SAM-dependent chlorinase/fluorinase [Candidatus Dormibacteraeota bacterium]|nr:SAM-dependent chlorinase/fluorinase [Candidatus Dormibacteraeota bacterium]MBV9525095.1 SAM-dependent chlorinase/fluorinase [Candidatus Dormibacteraeota bacterium]
MRRPLVFVTDYGRDDSYAAALVAAAWRTEPHLQCIDGTHGVPPGDALAAAYHLKALALAFDNLVVFCAVVDPGVGTSRRAIAVELDGVACVGPDNGLVSYIWEETPPGLRRCVELMVPEVASSTFHGRDVFAPTAARVAAGTMIEDTGEPAGDPMVLGEAFARRELSTLHGRVAVVDHFGNAITTIRDIDVADSRVVRVSWDGGETATVVNTYEEIGDGVGALFGSAGHLEVAARRGPASAHGGPAGHQDVTVETL